MKNYIGFVNDHSSSMGDLAEAAIRDYNAMISAVKDAASREMLDTVVSTVGIGIQDNAIERQVVISNPHVLKPVSQWVTKGLTPLYDGIGNIIELFQSLPDYERPGVSFLVFITTDGEEYGSQKYSAPLIKELICEMQKTGRWTFVFRVPKGSRHMVNNLGVPENNIQEWETTLDGMNKATKVAQQAMDTYFTSRSSGAKSSTTFYADTHKVDTSALTDISREVSLYVVPDADMGIEMRPFILRHRMEYLKGSAFYQLTKTESRVSHTKLIAIRERATGKVFSGKKARQMIGLPTDKNARLHPGYHGNFDIFIQSKSANRKLVGGTGVLYWAKIGVLFTEADRICLQPKAPVVKPTGPIVLPKVQATGKPTKSPIPKKIKTPVGDFVNGKPVKFFKSRRLAREFLGNNGNGVKDVYGNGWDILGNPQDHRWFVFL